MKRWDFRTSRNDADDSEWSKMCGSSSQFQVVDTLKENDLRPNVLVETESEKLLMRERKVRCMYNYNIIYHVS